MPMSSTDKSPTGYHKEISYWHKQVSAFHLYIVTFRWTREKIVLKAIRGLEFLT